VSSRRRWPTANAIDAGDVFAPLNLGYILGQHHGREHETESALREAITGGIVSAWGALGNLLAAGPGRDLGWRSRGSGVAGTRR
jgi:hypothetical protein